MLYLKTHSTTHQISSIPLTNTNQIQKPQTIVTPFNQFQPTQTHSLSHLQLKWRSKKPRGVNASSNNNGVEQDVRVRWGELVLDPDRDNVVAVGLTGALVWAGVQVLWHLFVVTLAIMVAAVKYTIVGVLLIFIVVTLL